MPVSFNRSAITVTLLLAAFTTTAAFAGTIRDDRSDSLYLNLGAAPAYAGVGQFLGSTSSYNFAASGTLIAPNWVLTAGHVVDNATSLSFTLGSSTFTASNWIANPKWTGNLNTGYDIALVHFDQNLTTLTGITPATRYTGSKELGKTATFVGYGTTGTGLTGYQNVSSFSQLQKRAGQNVLDTYLNTGGKPSSSRVLLADFDNPHTTADNNFGSATPLNLEYSIAPGDSGGGMFIDVNGIAMLAGVNSFDWGRLDGNPDADYGDVFGVTRVSQFNTWINSVIGTTSGGSAGGPRPRSYSKTGSSFSQTAIPEPATFALFVVIPLVCLKRRHA